MSMKISKKELQDLIAEEIKKSVEEGLFDKLKKGFDFFTKGREVEDPYADENAAEKAVQDKKADITTGLEKEKDEAKFAIRKAGEEIMDVFKYANKSQQEMKAKLGDFKKALAPMGDEKVSPVVKKFMGQADEFIGNLVKAENDYKTFYKDYSTFAKFYDKEYDKADFKADPTATMQMISRTRAGRGAPDDSKRGKMFAKESKEIRKTVKEEVYKALLNKVKK